MRDLLNTTIKNIYLMEIMFLKCVIFLPLEVEHPEQNQTFHSKLSRPPVLQGTMVSAPKDTDIVGLIPNLMIPNTSTFLVHMHV